jgi:hypothetical protein
LSTGYSQYYPQNNEYLTGRKISDRLRTSNQSGETVRIGIIVGETLVAGYGILIIGLASWAVGKMITGLAKGLFKL